MNIGKFLDPVITIGTLVSVIISLASFAAGIDAIYSVMFGLLGISISLLIDLIARNAHLELSVLQTVNLSRQVLKDQWFYERFVDIVQAWERLTTSNYHQLFFQYARLLIQGTRDQLLEIASGEMTVEAADFRVLAILIDGAQRTLKATSMVSPKFWNSSAGQNYWKKNQDALNQGVSITRIFICDEIDAEIQAIMDKMVDEGVRVFVAMKENLPPDLRLDFVVSDENLVVSATLMHEEHPVEHHISSKSEDVLKALGIFDRLMWLADDYLNVITRQSAT